MNRQGRREIIPALLPPQYNPDMQLSGHIMAPNTFLLIHEI